MRIAAYILLAIWLAGVVLLSLIEHTFFANNETWREYLRILMWPLIFGQAVYEFLVALWQLRGID